MSSRSQTLTRWAVRMLLFVSAICLLEAVRSFYPGRRVELPGKVREFRLFAHTPPSREGTLLVKVADWPFTLVTPLTLGEVDWPEKYSSSNFYWSQDGSLVIWRIRGISEPFEHNQFAYDFRDHRKIEWSPLWMKSDQLDRKLDALVKERGGLEPVPIEVPGLNTGMYDP